MNSDEDGIEGVRENGGRGVWSGENNVVTAASPIAMAALASLLNPIPERPML